MIDNIYDEKCGLLQQRATSLKPKIKILAGIGASLGIIAILLSIVAMNSGPDILGFTAQIPEALLQYEIPPMKGGASSPFTSPFSDVIDILESMGTLLGIMSMLFGVITGVVRQSISTLVMGLSFGMMVNYMPGIMREMIDMPDEHVSGDEVRTVANAVKDRDTDWIEKIYSSYQGNQLSVNFLVLQLSILSGTPRSDLFKPVVHALRSDVDGLGVKPDGHVAYAIEKSATGKIESQAAKDYERKSIALKDSFDLWAILFGIAAAPIGIVAGLLFAGRMLIERRLTRISEMKSKLSERFQKIAASTDAILPGSKSPFLLCLVK